MDEKERERKERKGSGGGRGGRRQTDLNEDVRECESFGV